MDSHKPKSFLYFFAVISLLILNSCTRSIETISFESEMYRLRTTDHLFLPQAYKLKQYSGFHREGLNPDRMHCLYEEDNWRVVADHKGKGVVSRNHCTQNAGTRRR